MKTIEAGLFSKVKSRIREASSYWSDSIKRIDSELSFVGGKQYTEEDDEIRGEGHANIVLNLTRQYCNMIINPYRASPFGINLTARRPEMAEKVAILKRVVRGIENDSNAKAQYTIGIDRQVKGGVGYLGLKTEFVDDESFEQRIRIISVIDPSMVIWDTLDKSVAGDKATWCVLVEHVSESTAKNTYGYEPQEHMTYTSVVEESAWEAPEGTVEIVHYFTMESRTKEIYDNGEGGVTDKQPRKKGVRSRQVKEKFCKVYHFCGEQQLGEETIWNIDRLPIIPVRGEMIDLGNGKVDFVGLVHWAKDPARLINWTASQTAERIAIAPKQTTYVDGESILPYKDIWKQAPRLNPPFLPYMSRDPNDPTRTFAPPQDRTVSVDINDTSSAQKNYESVLSGILGINPAGGDIAGVNNETATSVLTKNISQDMSNYHFPDNLSESIKELGRVLIQLIPQIYDVESTHTLVDEKGNSEDMALNLGEFTLSSKDYKVDVDAGPMMATKKREARSNLLALGQILGPEASLIFADDLVRSTDMEDADAIAEKVKLYAQNKLGLGGGNQDQPDQQATEALQVAESTIDQLTQQMQEVWRYAQALEAKLQNEEAKRQTDLLKTQMNNESKERITAMNLQGKQQETAMNMVNEQELQTQKLEADLLQASINQPAPDVNIIAGGDPVLRSIDGQRMRLPDGV